MSKCKTKKTKTKKNKQRKKPLMFGTQNDSILPSKLDTHRDNGQTEFYKYIIYIITF